MFFNQRNRRHRDQTSTTGLLLRLEVFSAPAISVISPDIANENRDAGFPVRRAAFLWRAAKRKDCVSPLLAWRKALIFGVA